VIDWNGIDRRLITLLRLVDWKDPEVQQVLRSIPTCSDDTLSHGDPVVFTGPDGARMAGVLHGLHPHHDDLPNVWATIAYIDRMGDLVYDRRAPAHYVLRRHSPHKVDELWGAKS
jgi:hypothetical protein